MAVCEAGEPLAYPHEQVAFFLGRELLLLASWWKTSFERRASAPIAFGGRGFLVALGRAAFRAASDHSGAFLGVYVWSLRRASKRGSEAKETPPPLILGRLGVVVCARVEKGKTEITKKCLKFSTHRLFAIDF